ncbi:hypothetical protein SAMN02745119_02242 [Trichlorobacter thiogenes]|uniref:Uncharacterized protein n=1 Tax=Trichlorobacter thiogenes TaxID=115783 RepID=A0A1T4Q5F6_9BACT|nr:hypothetical protein [Trichlorobacter thiogenes]SJZ98959.1 hypothetical protein SAMN02745119_02242 [Trichlorobacter thiogenes]
MKSASVITLFFCFLCLTILAPNRARAFQLQLPNTYQWKVQLPSDLPFDHYTITMQAGGTTNTVVLQRGQIYTWTAPYNTPLMTIEGWRVDKYNNRIYLAGRTCAGTDYVQGLNFVECKYSVSVRVCPKPSIPPDPVLENVKYGFCPN